MTEKLASFWQATRTLWASALFVGGILLVGWNARAMTATTPARLTALETDMGAFKADVKTEIGAVKADVSSVHQELNAHRAGELVRDKRWEDTQHQTNRIYCMILHPDNGLKQGQCARDEDRRTDVKQ